MCEFSKEKGKKKKSKAGKTRKNVTLRGVRPETPYHLRRIAPHDKAPIRENGVQDGEMVGTARIELATPTMST